MVIGTHTSHRDATFQALVDTTILAKNLLITSPTSFIIIHTADHFTIPWCQTMDRHDNVKACRAVCNTIADTLFMNENVMVLIRWIPGHNSFQPLKCLLEVATSSVREADPAPPPVGATIATLYTTAWTKSLIDWEQSWLISLYCDPAY
jgi:hypothetical protein